MTSDSVQDLSMSCTSLYVDQEGEIRLQGHGRKYVEFVSRVMHGPKKQFKREKDKKISVEERWWGKLGTLHAVQSGGCIRIVRISGGTVTPMMWHLHTVCPEFLEKADVDAVNRFLERIQEFGFVHAIFSRFKWMYKRREYTIPVNRAAVVRMCDMIEIPLDTKHEQALNLLDLYEGCSERNGHSYSGDTALPHTFFNGHQQGKNFLLDRGYFVQVDSEDDFGNKIELYKTPEVEQADNSIAQSLRTIHNRASRYPSPVSLSQLDELDDLQKQAVEMIVHNPVSILTGGPGCGKSHTLSAIIQCLKAGVFTPSHVSKKVQSKFIKRARAEAGVEVIQFVPYMFKYDHKSNRYFPSERGCKFFSSLGVDCDEHGSIDKETLSTCMRTIVFDETGMMDLFAVAETLAWAVEHFTSLCRVAFCGDSNQFQSVTRGNVLPDLLKSEQPHVQLQLSHRAVGALVRNFPLMSEGNANLEQDETFTIHDCTDTIQVYKTTTHWGVKKHNIPTPDVLRLFNSDREAGQEPHIITYDKKAAKIYNEAIETALFGERPKGSGPRAGLKMQAISNEFEDQSLCKRDLVILDNDVDYDVDDEVDEQTGRTYRRCRLTFRRWLGPEDEETNTFNVTMRIRSLKKDLDVGYATTGHSVQGGQMPYVMCDAVNNVQYTTRQFIYTGSSRAQKRCRIITARTKGSDLDLQTILERPAPVRVSDLDHVIRACLGQQNSKKRKNV